MVTARAPRADFALSGGRFPLNTEGRVKIAPKDAAIARAHGTITATEEAIVDRKAAAKRHSSKARTNGGMTAYEHRTEAHRLRGEGDKRHGMARVHEARADVLDAKDGNVPSVRDFGMINLANVPMARKK